MFDPYDIEKDRGPDPNMSTHRLVANATWDVPVGRDRKHGADMPGGPTRCSAAGRSRRSFQARSGQHLTPFFSGFYTTSPWNTGKPLDGLGTASAARGGRTRSRTRTAGGTREAFFDQTAYAIPADGKLGNAKKGSLIGPGHVGRELRLLQGRGPHRPVPAAVLAAARQRVQPPAVPPDLRERVRRPDRYLIDGDRRQRDDRRPRRRLDRQRRGVRARSRHTSGLAGDILGSSPWRRGFRSFP